MFSRRSKQVLPPLPADCSNDSRQPPTGTSLQVLNPVCLGQTYPSCLTLMLAPCTLLFLPGPVSFFCEQTLRFVKSPHPPPLTAYFLGVRVTTLSAARAMIFALHVTLKLLRRLCRLILNIWIIFILSCLDVS